jgi:hypothetical protein
MDDQWAAKRDGQSVVEWVASMAVPSVEKMVAQLDLKKVVAKVVRKVSCWAVERGVQLVEMKAALWVEQMVDW